MQRYKVVFTTERSERHQQAALKAAPENLEVTMLRHPDRETLLAYLAKADYLISERTGVIDAGLIQAAPKLKLILRLGSLTYDIDTAAAKAAGVIVCFWPVRSTGQVAEFLILQMLTLGKRLHEAEAIALEASPDWGVSRRTDEDSYAYNWSKRQNMAGLWQKTVGILGFGEIGAEVARRLQGWGCTLLYHKRHRLPQAVEAELGLMYVEAATLFTESDYLANLLPYAPSTDRLINAERLARMKAGAYLVSCGSGSVIDEAALAEAIKSGKLAGAALDTYEWEPLRPDNPLIPLAKAGYNILLTPHVAAVDTATRTGMKRSSDYTNIINHINAQPILNRVV